MITKSSLKRLKNNKVEALKEYHYILNWQQISGPIVGFRLILTRKHQRMIRHLDTGTSAYLYLELRSPTDRLQRFLHKSFHRDPHY